jgi:hypothetical protein
MSTLASCKRQNIRKLFSYELVVVDVAAICSAEAIVKLLEDTGITLQHLT